MFDLRNFKIFLAKNNLTQQDIAKVLGIGHDTLSRKIHGKSDFTLKELNIFIKEYGLDDARDIFFSE